MTSHATSHANSFEIRTFFFQHFGASNDTKKEWKSLKWQKLLDACFVKREINYKRRDPGSFHMLATKVEIKSSLQSKKENEQII